MFGPDGAFDVWPAPFFEELGLDVAAVRLELSECAITVLFCRCSSTTAGVSAPPPEAPEPEAPEPEGWALATSGPVELLEGEGEGEGEGVDVVFAGGPWDGSASWDSVPEPLEEVEEGAVEPSVTTPAPSAPPVRGPPSVAAVRPPPARADSNARHVRRRGLLIGGMRQAGSSCGRPIKSSANWRKKPTRVGTPTEIHIGRQAESS